MEGSGISGAMTSVTEVTGGLLEVAADVVSFITSNPLLMIGIGVSFALLAVKLIKRFF